MKFVDEAKLKVQAGNGGRGCVSFRREKFAPFGGPDGGDGGLGGSVYLKAVEGMNTLADFRISRTYKGQNGESGSGNDCTGHGGDDTYVSVPVGTVVSDRDTGEQLGDLAAEGQTLLVAKGGKGGWGNTRFKSSTNRTPRKSGLGLPGEKRELMLELKLIADVGLLGLPNAGKSTLIRAVSAARPKVADYPFTTLHPNLGVVTAGPGRSFVMADIPGLIEGAADGAGLGIRFLKHLQRTRVLLHLIDIAPPDPGADPVKDARTIVAELKQSFANAIAVVTKVPTSDIAAPLPKLGPDANKGDVEYLLVTHAHEHLGQSIAYARSVGVTPPWTVAAEAAAKKKAAEGKPEGQKPE